MSDSNGNNNGAPAQEQPERFNPYTDDTGMGVEIGRRLAAVIDTSPYLLWSEQESGELSNEFYVLAPDMAPSARARRLAVEFAQAFAGGMPERTRLLIMTEWAAVLLRELPDADGRAVLAQAVETAQVAMAMPEPLLTPELDAALRNIEDTEFPSVLCAAAAWTKYAVWHYLEPQPGSKSAPAYKVWWRAIDMLGSIAQAMGDRAEQAFVECERLMARRIYVWAPVTQR